MVFLPPDITGFFLPFLFVLAVVFGGLEMSGIFESKDGRSRGKAAKLLISAVIAFIAASSPLVLGFLSVLLPYAALLFVAVFFLGFLWKLGSKKAQKKDYTLILIIAALALVALSAFGTDLTRLVPGLGLSQDQLLTAAGLVFIFVILVAAYSKAGEEGKK